MPAERPSQSRAVSDECQLRVKSFDRLHTAVGAPQTQRTMNMTPATKSDMRRTAAFAVRSWMNAYDDEPRELLKGAFRFIRYRLRDGLHLQAAIGALESDALRYRDC